MSSKTTSLALLFLSVVGISVAGCEALVQGVGEVLQVVIAGSGSGAITSGAGGAIACGNFAPISPTQCSATIDQGDSITLTATPQPNSQFAGWSGGGCTGTAATCTVSMTQAETVTANFNAIQDSLQITVTGTGAGTVTSSPTGITCGAGYTGAPTACAVSISQGTMVTLTAAPQPNSQFASWTGGGCSGSALTCTVDISQAQAVTAVFNVILDTFKVTIAGMGAGTVTSAPAGISCGANYAGAPTACSENIAQGGMVTLTAAAQSGSKFASWSGGVCAGVTASTCQVDVSQAQTITATFNVIELTAPLVTSVIEGQFTQGQVQALGISYYIAVFGVFPSQSGGSGNSTGQPYLGQVAPFAIGYAPSGWLLCDGTLLTISQYTALFSLLGTNYGGNGTTTFALPDLRGRVPMGVGGTPATTPPGTSEVPVVSSIAAGSVAEGQIDALGMNYYIALAGVYPSASSTTTNTTGPFVGQIESFALGFAPVGWALCDGSSLPISSNTALFSLLGTTYGGNGTTDFSLPDLRGRVAIGVGDLTNPVIPPTSSTDVPVAATPAIGSNSVGQVNALGVGYYITVEGVFPSSGSSTTSANFLGQITLFAGNFAPAGWMPCEGQTLNISQYTALFALLGTTYGGNGTSTFMLPDLRARAVMGVGTN